MPINQSVKQGPVVEEILYETSMLLWDKSLYDWSWSHDKNVAMPINGKTPLKIFFSRTSSQMTLKLGTQQKGLELYKSYINDDYRVYLVLFYNKVNFVHLVFYIGKVCPRFQTSSPQKPLNRLK